MWNLSRDIHRVAVMESPAPLSVVTCFTLILDGLMAAIAARIQDYPFTSEMVVFLWKRVNTVKNRFLALAALIQAGKIFRERVSNPRARNRSETVKPPGINWRKWLPMSRFAWLCRLMPSLANRFGAAQFGCGLRDLLGKPEMKALLAATPKAGRTLAPLCFMLGIDAALLRPGSPAPTRAPSVPAPAPEITASKADVAPKDNAGEPLPSECAPPRALHPPPDPGVEFFQPA
jgi:hypothetical protein